MEMDIPKLKYWNIEEVCKEVLSISLEDPSLLLSNYKFDNGKLIIYFDYPSILGAGIKLFSNRENVMNYLFMTTSRFLIFEDDIEISFKEKVFEYPFFGIVEDDFKNGIQIKFKKERHKEKIINLLDSKLERLISTKRLYV